MENIAKSYEFFDVKCTPDNMIGLHRHQEMELSYVIKGSGVRMIGDQSEEFHDGEVLLLPSGIRHVWNFSAIDTDSEGCVECISVLLNINVLKGIESVFPETSDAISTILRMTDAIIYGESMRTRLANILISMRYLRDQDKIPKIMELILAMSDMGSTRIAGKEIMLSPAEHKLEKLKVFCNCNFNKRITLEAAANIVKMNKSAFCVFVKKHTGMTFSEYLNNIRLQIAADYLQSGNASISEIAYSSGFGGIPYFNHVFKSKFGISPSQYRKKLKE